MVMGPETVSALKFIFPKSRFERHQFTWYDKQKVTYSFTWKNPQGDLKPSIPAQSWYESVLGKSMATGNLLWNRPHEHDEPGWKR
jgi:hypothetical protein